MKRCLRLLLCLPLLATPACAADVISEPALSPTPRPVAQPASEQAAQVAAPAPGSLSRLAIRGLKVPAQSAEVVYIIDGVPALAAEAQARMEADDIESIQVVKGDALAALYVHRPLKGVVIITTRNAAARRPR